MKNFLLYPDCFSADSINQCRLAILKFLGSYNLTPPANISVIIHTNKAAAFEIFQPFLKEGKIVESTTPVEWSTPSSLQAWLTGYEGNLLVCRSNGYSKLPLEPLFETIQEGRLCYSPQPGEVTGELWTKFFLKNLFAIGLPSSFLQNAGASFGAAEKADPYFTVYKNRRSFNQLLQKFFLANEEESIANLVKKARHLDMEAFEAEAEALDRLPLFRRWIQKLSGKNSLLRQYQNKLSP